MADWLGQPDHVRTTLEGAGRGAWGQTRPLAEYLRQPNSTSRLEGGGSWPFAAKNLYPLLVSDVWALVLWERSERAGSRQVGRLFSE